MAYNDSYGKTQFNGNRSGGGFQNRNQKEDLIFAPTPVEFKFYDEKGFIAEKLLDVTAESIAKTFIVKDSSGKKNSCFFKSVKKVF